MIKAELIFHVNSAFVLQSSVTLAPRHLLSKGGYDQGFYVDIEFTN